MFPGEDMLRADGYDDESSFGSLFEENSDSNPEPEMAALLEKLNRADRDKSQLRTKLEAVTEGWKRERRQFRTEIDELHQRVDSMREQIKGANQLQRRLDETRRYSQELETQCEQLRARLDSERNRLQSRIEDLEAEILEVLDRFNNAHRTTQDQERRMEAELATHKRTLEIESNQRFRSNEVQLKKDHRTLELEIERLKKELAARPATKRSLIERFFSHR